MRLDLAAYRSAMIKTLREANEKAGRAWIRAAVDETPIPTWSGASRATFQKLASELGTSVPIGPIRSQKSRISLGLSTSIGSGVIKSENFVGFVYNTNLRYLQYNEFNRALKGKPPQPYSNNVRFTPYNFQRRAEAAWQKEAVEVRLPNPWNFLRTRSI
jgi:hypothetical protein